MISSIDSIDSSKANKGRLKDLAKTSHPDRYRLFAKELATIELVDKA